MASTTDLDRAFALDYERSWRAGWKPEPKLRLSEWAERNMVLTSESSAEPGLLDLSRTPYLREPMDLLSVGDPTEEVVLQFGSQLGKTTLILAWIGYVIDHDPGPMLMVQPTVNTAKKYSRQRIDPMIAASPVLRGKVAEPRSRDSSNTVLMKEFPGGILFMTGSNSPSELASTPIEKLALDEYDRYDGDVGGEGDPGALAEQRTVSFADSKTVKTSTPTVRERSRIERDLLHTDLCRYYIPCPECGQMDFLTWSGPDTFGVPGVHHRIHIPEGQPQEAAMVCSGCGSVIPERKKPWMLERGKWVATRDLVPGLPDRKPGARGFHLSALYAPYGWKKSSWGRLARRWAEVQTDREQLKTFVNTVLAETWEERGERVGVELLAERAKAEQYEAVPAGVGILVSATDTQDDRLETLVVGYGAGEESWLIQHAVFRGDPGDDAVWFERDRFLEAGFAHQGGRVMPVEVSVIDSGGHHTDKVYEVCAARYERKHFAIRGGRMVGLPLVGDPSTANRLGIPLWTLCVDTGKLALMSRLKVARPGPKFIHLREAVATRGFLEQLTSEKLEYRQVRGRGKLTKRVWVPTRDRNEALDLFVYAMAALDIAGEWVKGQLAARAVEWAKPPQAPAPPAPDPLAGQPGVRRGQRTWMSGWKLGK